MMYITHLAIWTNRLEELKDFYVRWFGARAGEKYTNPQKGFESYFLTFRDGPSLELMRRYDITQPATADGEQIGLAHFAFCAGAPRQVDEWTERFRQAGFRIAGEPRTTGDGFYEAAVLDPDGNRIELVAE